MQRAERLRAAGFAVDHRPMDAAALRALRAHPPTAVVIDLSRLPAQGRDVGLALRTYKDTRHVPLVFVEGEPEKVARVREHLPDATYATWARVGTALRRAIARPPTHPVRPSSLLAGYSGTPLPKKLGIKTGSVVALVDAPAGFDETLGALPDGVTIGDRAVGGADLIIWFVTRRRDLQRRVRKLGALAGRGGLWIVWPKKSSGTPSDLTQAAVRAIGLASGLVDYKVCAIDARWTGLRFTQRAKRP